MIIKKKTKRNIEFFSHYTNKENLRVQLYFDG